MSRARTQRILRIVQTDTSFIPRELRGETVWVGRCIHCDRKLMVALDGEPLGPVTIEHIIPRHHGGDNEPMNTALACDRCNNAKGYRLDHLSFDDERLQRMISQLQDRRAKRWRSPDEAPNPLLYRR